MRPLFILLVALAAFAGGEVHAATGPAARLSLYSTSGETDWAVGLEYAFRPILPIPGEEVFTVEAVLDEGGAVFSLVHRFRGAATSASGGGYLGLGVGLVASVFGVSEPALKVTAGSDFASHGFAEIGYLWFEHGAFVGTVGLRF